MCQAVGDSPKKGGIHTFPAVSSVLVVGSDLICLRSASSAADSAQGNEALNRPVALM